MSAFCLYCVALTSCRAPLTCFRQLNMLLFWIGHCTIHELFDKLVYLKMPR